MPSRGLAGERLHFSFYQLSLYNGSLVHSESWLGRLWLFFQGVLNSMYNGASYLLL